MIKLSDRLQVIADRLEDCKTMADIGTDHGFLPVYMVESGRCTDVIAADISEPSLDKARRLCREHGIDRCQLRAGDGIHVLMPGEVDGLVIAGMGGDLIIEILSSAMDVTCTMKRIVLQPRSAIGVLRRWLVTSGFSIIHEDVVAEGRFMPEIITVIPPGQDMDGLVNLADAGTAGDGELYYDVPLWFTAASGPAAERVKRVLRREKTVLEGLLNARTIE